MCKAINDEQKKAVEKKAEEITLEENKETANAMSSTLETAVEGEGKHTPKDSTQVIGHVPVPGSGTGTGKGTTVKK